MKPNYYWSEHFGVWVARFEVPGWPMWIKPCVSWGAVPRF